VALAEDEPVALRVARVLGVDVEDGAVERHQDVRDGVVATDVAETRSVDHVQVRQADRAGQPAQGLRLALEGGSGQLGPEAPVPASCGGISEEHHLHVHSLLSE
jgi:hypothetical protein